MIVLENVIKKYGDFTAVSDLNFKINKGEIIGLIGSNGAGKSTVMRMLTGFLKPTSGSISIGGVSVIDHPKLIQREIGYLPENAPIYPEMTVLEFLSFIADMRGYQGAEAKQALDRVITMTGLSRVLRQTIGTLSKGYKQRVCFAQALVHDPTILILDEPTDGLDPNQKYEVRNIIQQMAKNKLILFSTHILEEIEAVCSRVLLIHGGKLLADTTPAKLQASSKRHNVVSILLEQKPQPEILQKIADINNVSHYELEETPQQQHRLLIFPVDGSNILQSVQLVFSNAQYKILEWDMEKGKVEEVFRSLTIGNQQIDQTTESKQEGNV